MSGAITYDPSIAAWRFFGEPDAHDIRFTGPDGNHRARVRRGRIDRDAWRFLMALNAGVHLTRVRIPWEVYCPRTWIRGSNKADNRRFVMMRAPGRSPVVLEFLGAPLPWGLVEALREQSKKLEERRNHGDQQADQLEAPALAQGAGSGR